MGWGLSVNPKKVRRSPKDQRKSHGIRQVSLGRSHSVGIRASGMLPNRNVIYCFGRRGLTEIVAESGDGLHFELWDGHGWQGRFFWNIGQPQQDPPCHLCHKDDPGVCGAIRASAGAFRPFHAKYTLLGENSFEWIQNGDGLFLRASTVDPVRFHRVTAGDRQIKERALVLSGVEPGREYRGHIQLALSVGKLGADILSDRCCSLPEASNLCNPAEAALFFNLSQSPLLANTFYLPVNKTWHSFMGRIFGLSAETDLLLFAWDGALMPLLSPISIRCLPGAVFSHFSKASPLTAGCHNSGLARASPIAPTHRSGFSQPRRSTSAQGIGTSWRKSFCHSF